MKPTKLTLNQLMQDAEVIEKENLNNIKGGQQEVTYNGGTLQEVTITGNKPSSNDNFFNFMNFNRYNNYNDSSNLLSSWGVGEGSYGGGGGYTSGFASAGGNDSTGFSFAQSNMGPLIMAGLNFGGGDAIFGGTLNQVTITGTKNSNSSSSILNTTNTALGYIGYTEAGLSTAQYSMLKYRQSLPINERIGNFGSFSNSYKILGKAGKALSAVGYVGAIVNTAVDYNAMENGEIGAGRFTYRTIGTGIGIAVGATAGAIPATVLGGGIWAGEQLYDGYMYWQTETAKFLNDIERGMNNNYVPGRY